MTYLDNELIRYIPIIDRCFVGQTSIFFHNAKVRNTSIYIIIYIVRVLCSKQNRLKIECVTFYINLIHTCIKCYKKLSHNWDKWSLTEYSL